MRKRLIEIFKDNDTIRGSYYPLTQETILSGKYTERKQLIDKLTTKLNDCFHKAEAAAYCLNQIKTETSNKLTTTEVKNYSEMIANKMCKIAELKNEVLIFETEAFLFQVKSNLDILVQVLKHLYPKLRENKKYDSESYKFNPKDIKQRTTYIMKQSGYLDMANYFEKQEQDWIANLIEMRNEIAHRSALSGFTCYVFESNTSKLINPTMPNGKEVLNYCEETYEKLIILYSYVIQNFITPKFDIST